MMKLINLITIFFTYNKLSKIIKQHGYMGCASRGGQLGVILYFSYPIRP